MNSGGLLTWHCGCQQDPRRPVGEYLFRCDQHPVQLRYCPICDAVVTRWDWQPTTGYRIQPCGHNTNHLIERSTSGPMP